MTDTPTRPFSADSFRKYIGEGKLMGSRCKQCGKFNIPPRAICPNCRSADLAWEAAPATAKLAAYTVIGIVPTAMSKLGFSRDNPYLSGIVEFKDGSRLSTRLTGIDASHPEAVKIGTPMKAVFLEDVPADAPAAPGAPVSTLAFAPLSE